MKKIQTPLSDLYERLNEKLILTLYNPEIPNNQQLIFPRDLSGILSISQKPNQPNSNYFLKLDKEFSDKILKDYDLNPDLNLILGSQKAIDLIKNQYQLPNYNPQIEPTNPYPAEEYILAILDLSKGNQGITTSIYTVSLDSLEDRLTNPNIPIESQRCIGPECGVEQTYLTKHSPLVQQNLKMQGYDINLLKELTSFQILMPPSISQLIQNFYASNTLRN